MAELKEISPNAAASQKLLNWVDNRFPLSKLYNEHMAEYYAPKNFNFWYIFGSLALLVLVIQIVTGIFLVMHYKPDVLVVVGICTHLGCSPTDKFQPGPQPSLPDNWEGGFLCPCHGSTFDMAGRVFKNKPAPDNLEVPPHMYLSDTKLLIGEDKKA